jgi:hypothetical protein
LLRWLNLDDSETLELECGEDIDTVGNYIRASVSQKTRLFEQVKRHQANITLRSPISLEALANFADHRSSNPEWRLRFRLLTTAKIGRELRWQGELEGIALWEAIRAGDLSEEAREVAVQQIRTLLQQSKAPEPISVATWQIFQAVVQSNAEFNDFIEDFEWSTSSDDYRLFRQSKTASDVPIPRGLRLPDKGQNCLVGRPIGPFSGRHLIVQPWLRRLGHVHGVVSTPFESPI